MSADPTADLVRYRMEQARVAIEDARFLLNGDRSPQSVVNRAYYAMFYAAMALLQKTGKVPSKHTGVISLFDTEYVMKGVFRKDMSRDFHAAFGLRQTSDYKEFEPVSRKQAEKTLEDAVRFVAAVEDFFRGR